MTSSPPGSRHRPRRRRGHPDAVRDARRCCTRSAAAACSATSGGRRRLGAGPPGRGRRPRARARRSTSGTRLDPAALVAVQEEQLGHRACRRRSALDGAAARSDDGLVVVTYGDVPLLTRGDAGGLVEAHVARRQRRHRAHRRRGRPDRLRPGRARRRRRGDARSSSRRTRPTAQRAVTEINSGIYAFDAAVLREALAAVGNDNAQGEKYLTDVVGIAARGRAARRGAARPTTCWQTEGVNDRVQLAASARELNRRVLDRLDARRRDGRRPGDDLGRRRRSARRRRHAAAGHPAASARRAVAAGAVDRPRHHADRRRGRRRRPRRPHPRLAGA